MTHNNDIVAFFNEITQRMGDDPRSHSRPLLYRIGLAAIEGLPLANLDRCLISAPAESKIKTASVPSVQAP